MCAAGASLGGQRDQRTCCSYSLPCFSFPVAVHGVDLDVVGGHGLEPLHHRGAQRPRDLQGHLAAPQPLGDVPQPVVGHLPRSGGPRHAHGALCLLRHHQRLACRRGCSGQDVGVSGDRKWVMGRQEVGDGETQGRG